MHFPCFFCFSTLNVTDCPGIKVCEVCYKLQMIYMQDKHIKWWDLVDSKNPGNLTCITKSCTNVAICVPGSNPKCKDCRYDEKLLISRVERYDPSRK